MTESAIVFQGSGPFHIPTAQSAIACGNPNNGVTLTFYCLLPDMGPTPQPISVQMTSKNARDLATALIRASFESDGGKEIVWPSKDS